MLKLPKQVGILSNSEATADSYRMKLDLNPVTPPPLSSSSVNLNTLCTDVQLEILDHLRLVDRLCLGLTCKSMAKLILLSTKLTPANWTPLAYSRISHETAYDLFPRLMHGWVPKDRFRFCTWCGKIYTRSPQFWESRGMLAKPLVWSPRLSVRKHEWMLMSKKAKYKWLILRWRDAHSEDGSGARCVPCGIKLNDRLWYDMIHCPECTASTLAASQPGRPRPHRYGWIETACMEACETVCCCAMAAFEAVGGTASSLARSAMSQLQIRIRKGRYILPKWRGD